jgi:hypothetical protein
MSKRSGGRDAEGRHEARRVGRCHFLALGAASRRVGLALAAASFYSINHGPTTSLYYSDPDGNRVELLVDNFATAEEGQAWMHSPAFERNPIGVAFDPDELVRRFRSGVPVAELVIRDA